MFRTKLIPQTQNGMFIGYKKGTQDEFVQSCIEDLENEYKEHEIRMQEIKKEIDDLKGEKTNA